MRTPFNFLLPFLLCVAQVFLGGIAAADSANARPASIARRPNLLFILTDDQRWDALGVVQREQGNQARFPWFTTPNLDRLAAEGVRFRNAFGVHSLCSPSRASFLSGQYGHRNGVIDNRTAFPENAVNQAKLLRAAGYTTAYIGKFHMGSQRERPGFDFIASYTGQGMYDGGTFLVNGSPRKPTGWVDDIAADFALQFIRTNRTNPWMMMLGFKSSHTPRQPPERARARFAGAAVKPAANANAKPPYGKGQLALREDKPGKPEEALTDSEGGDDYLINYFRCLSAVDDNVGRILVELDTLGVAQDTVVVFAGDNGYFLGEHGLGDKRAAYEEGMRIPLLLRYPRLVPRAKVVDELVLNIDLAPTFLDLAGLAVPVKMQGASWRPLLTGTNRHWRKAFLFEYFFESDLPATPAILAVRTPTAKLIQYPGHPEWTEVFDLRTDPFEKQNVAHSGTQRHLVKRLEDELHAQTNQFGDPFSTSPMRR
jgi:arylsulfatase A-like enzyme